MNNKTALYIAWTVALLATAGSLFLSLALHWTPCDLCWYQRIVMYPLVIILGVAIWKDIRDVDLIVLPMAYLGIMISIFHNLLKYHILPEKLGPCTVSASCILSYHFFYNWITIPLLSFASFAVIIICIYVYRRTKV